MSFEKRPGEYISGSTPHPVATRATKTMTEHKRGDESMLYVVSYDIPDDRRRSRVHSALTGFGTWVQYSVFECFLDRKQRIQLEARLLKEIHYLEDTIRIYGLCGACIPKVQVLGQGEQPREDSVYLL